MTIPDHDTIVHLIQLSVAPVFLLAGVAGLLNVFTGRLTRIIDKLEKVDTYVNEKKEEDESFKECKRIETRRDFLIMRMENTNLAIFFCAATGLMVATVILSIFAGALFSFPSKFVISISYILAMFFLILSLILFLREIYYTTSYIRLKKNQFH